MSFSSVILSFFLYVSMAFSGGEVASFASADVNEVAEFPVVSGEVQLINHEVKEKDGKKVVEAQVTNAGESRKVSVIIIGYDKENQAIETRGLNTFMGSGKKTTFTYPLLYGSQVVETKAFLADPTKEDVKIASLAYKQDGDSMVITAVVENGIESGKYGIALIGYDESGKAILTKGFNEFISKGDIGNFGVKIKDETSVKSVVAKLIDVSHENVKLVSQADRKVGNQIQVSAVVENISPSRNIGLYAVGYDVAGNPIVTRSANNFVPKQELGSYTIPLRYGENVASINVFISELPKNGASLNGQAFYLNGTIMEASAVVSNGEKSDKYEVIATAVNAEGKVIESQKKDKFVSKHDASTYEFSFENGGGIKEVKFELKKAK
ncbi:hypothetical protein [Brevibacillus daliensis]|uniref:hypothetical protein n=1 Tax=Brevibacillus daliensis TaxID=2892995 RepID=UPI001E603261|nr:hypothetical protein [Brevibacillus daliensis]